MSINFSRFDDIEVLVALDKAVELVLRNTRKDNRFGMRDHLRARYPAIEVYADQNLDGFSRVADCAIEIRIEKRVANLLTRFLDGCEALVRLDCAIERRSGSE